MSTDRVYVRSMPSALMTAEELLQTSIPDKHVELVRGVLVVREPAGYRHGRVSMDLRFLLARHVKETGAGQVVSAETGFKLMSDPDTVRAPDVAFIARERLPDPPARRNARQGRRLARRGHASRLGHRPRAARRSCVQTGWDRNAPSGDQHARRRGRAPGLLLQSQLNFVGTLRRRAPAHGEPGFPGSYRPA